MLTSFLFCFLIYLYSITEYTLDNAVTSFPSISTDRNNVEYSGLPTTALLASSFLWSLISGAAHHYSIICTYVDMSDSAPNTVIVCNKKGKIYICGNNHRNCPECVLYRGVSRTTKNQRLPSFVPVCNICGEVSNLDQVSLCRERERLNIIVDNFRHRGGFARESKQRKQDPDISGEQVAGCGSKHTSVD